MTTTGRESGTWFGGAAAGGNAVAGGWIVGGPDGDVAVTVTPGAADLISGPLLSTPSDLAKLTWSTSSSSNTSRGGWPFAESSTEALAIRTGPVRSNTIREPPGITSPSRNALISPRPAVPEPVGR